MRSTDKERKERSRGINQMVLKIVTKKANSRRLPWIHCTKILYEIIWGTWNWKNSNIWHNYDFFLLMWERSLSYKMSKHDCFHACPCPQLHLGEDHPKPWVWMPDRGLSLVTLEAEEHCNTTLLLWSTKDITTKPRWRVLCKDKVTLALCWLLLADMPRAARTCVMLMHLRNALLCPHRFWCKLVKFCMSFNRGRVRHHDEVANAPGRLLLLLLRMYVNGNGWEIKDQLRLSLN